MKRIFLTSGLIICMACPAFATKDLDTSGHAQDITNGKECVEPVLGVFEADQNSPVQLEAKWTANKSGAITLVSSIYPSDNHSATALYTGADNDGLTTATPTPVYSVYNTGIYSDANATTAITELATDPSKVGYIFNGFYTADGQTQVIDNAGVFTADAKTQISSIGGTATWYAHWTPKQYNVSYNSGLHGSSTANPSVDPVVYTNGLTYDATWTSKTLAENNFAADAGYTFTGWNTAQDGSGTAYTAGASQSAWQTDAALTLYAIYSTNQYTISYAPGLAGSHTAQEDYVKGSTAATTGVDFDDVSTTLATNAFTATGYHFVNWLSEYNLETNAQTNTYYNSGASIGSYRHPDNITLTAQWAANTATISYSCVMDDTQVNNASVYTGTAPTSNTSATYDAAFAFAANSNCARPGWVFDGWTCKVGNTTLTIADVYGANAANGTSTVLPANSSSTWLYEGANEASISCVAHYTANQINVTWYKNAGSDDSVVLQNTCTYDGSLAVPQPNPTRNGYQFSGWTVRQSND